ncbi:MAG: RadC family protein [Clostridia bacterium]|nr:RadC family protein [Clostridia bacterium]
MHEHHRKRMKERFLREGIENFEPHNVLELLLFYSIPQKDTNEIAHRLIERFGSISAVFDAPYSELIKIDGIKEHSATLIKLVPALSQRYMSEAFSLSGTILPTMKDVGKYFVAKYIGATNEIVYLLLMDNKYKVIDCVKIFEGSVNSAAITMRKLIEAAISSGAAFAVLAHNHPNGLAIPSGEDINTTREAKRALELIGVSFLGHILVAGNKYTDITKP